MLPPNRLETASLLVFALGIGLGPAFGFPAPMLSDYLVGAPSEMVTVRGGLVTDDYGSFVSARMSEDTAAQFSIEGIVVVPQKYSVGRGAVRLVPPPGNEGDPSASHYVVQFRGPVKQEWREELQAHALLYDYLPHHAFLVRFLPGGQEWLAMMPEVRAIFPYSPEFKLSPELPKEGSVEATILVYPDVVLDPFLSLLEVRGAVVLGFARTSLESVVDARLEASRLAEVAQLEDVAWIEPAYDAGSLDNEQASSIVQDAELATWSLDSRGLDGSSQVLNICDTGVNTNIVGTSTQAPATPLIKLVHDVHDDENSSGVLAYNAHLLPATPPLSHRKVDLYYSPQENGNRGDERDTNGHGTHTAGTLAGDAAPYGVRNGHDGVAFASRLLLCDISIGDQVQILNDYANYWDPGYERGARISSNSWGSTPTNAYTEKARQHDAYAWNHRDFLILRSMGNSGPGAEMRPEAVAKNVVSVGATHNGLAMDVLSASSTGGPTPDGRVKPNVVAPGRCLVSSYLPNPDSYECLSGTSMSTPVVAGAAALIRDYFEKGFYPSGSPNPANASRPSSSLVRAILQISGREISDDRNDTSFPNGAQGWGRVTLDDALYFSGDALHLVALDESTALETGQTFEAQLDVQAGQTLRIMLAWTDAPGAAGTSIALVNDLDLEVKGPGGPPLQGNSVLNASSAHGQSPPDDLNVEEAVFISDPHEGTYKIRVTARNVPAGPQPFALVATGDVRLS